MRKCSIQSVINSMSRLAPKNLAEEWDNPGLLIGDPSTSINKIFVCLDVLDDTITRAIEFGADLIVAHHPLIFKGIKNIRLDFSLGKKISRLLENKIAVYAAHTNLDRAIGGVNDILAQKIGLHDVKMLGDEEISMGRIGSLETPMTVEDFALHVKKSLDSKNLRFVKAGDFSITKIGVCGGSGAEFIQRAKFFGAQAFVTGDVKYHDAQAAVENNIHVIDAGHFATEFPIVQSITDYLCDELKYLDIEIIADNGAEDFFKTI